MCLGVTWAVMCCLQLHACAVDAPSTRALSYTYSRAPQLVCCPTTPLSRHAALLLCMGVGCMGTLDSAPTMHAAPGLPTAVLACILTVGVDFDPSSLPAAACGPVA